MPSRKPSPQAPADAAAAESDAGASPRRAAASRGGPEADASAEEEEDEESADGPARRGAAAGAAAAGRPEPPLARRLAAEVDAFLSGLHDVLEEDRLNQARGEGTSITLTTCEHTTSS